MKKVKVMHIVSGMNFGGVESVIKNYYSHMNTKNLNSIIVSHDRPNPKEAAEFKELGFKIFSVTPKSKNPILNYRELAELMRKEKPDIVHVHMGDSSYFALQAARLNKVPIRICHSHEASAEPNLRYKVGSRLSKKYATHLMACTKDAAESVFGTTENVEILPNAIAINNFKFSKIKRNKMRKQLEIKDEILIGHIGRFEPEKNHEQIISIFRNMIENEINAKLLLIGTGSTKEDIKEQVRKFKLTDRVIMLPTIPNVSDYYQAMDALIFPSFNEGLGIVPIEAQISGLPCVISDVIPEDVDQTNLVTRVSLDDPNSKWIKALTKKSKANRGSYYKKMQKSPYNIKESAHLLSDYYKEITKKNEQN